jgi:hypothetical protein
MLTRILGGLGLAGSLLLAVPAVVAETIQCPNEPDGVCVGTDDPDILNGRKSRDFMLGLGDDDELNGRDKADRLHGDAQGVPENGGDYDGSLDGDDTLNAGGGDDELDGYGGSDTLLGGGGRDNMVALEYAGNGEDTVNAGGGGAFIAADDEVKDIITCGKGRDVVWFDEGLDEITNINKCESLNPVTANGTLRAEEVVGTTSAEEEDWHEGVKRQFEEWRNKR